MITSELVDQLRMKGRPLKENDQDDNIPARLKKKKKTKFKTVACRIIIRGYDFELNPIVVPHKEACIAIGRYTVDELMIRSVAVTSNNLSKITCIKNGRAVIKNWMYEDYGEKEEDQTKKEEDNSLKENTAGDDANNMVNTEDAENEKSSDNTNIQVNNDDTDKEKVGNVNEKTNNKETDKEKNDDNMDNEESINDTSGDEDGRETDEEESEDDVEGNESGDNGDDNESQSSHEEMEVDDGGVTNESEREEFATRTESQQKRDEQKRPQRGDRNSQTRNQEINKPVEIEQMTYKQLVEKRTRLKCKYQHLMDKIERRNVMIQEINTFKGAIRRAKEILGPDYSSGDEEDESKPCGKSREDDEMLDPTWHIGLLRVTDQSGKTACRLNSKITVSQDSILNQEGGAAIVQILITKDVVRESFRVEKLNQTQIETLREQANEDESGNRISKTEKRSII